MRVERTLSDGSNVYANGVVGPSEADIRSFRPRKHRGFVTASSPASAELFVLNSMGTIVNPTITTIDVVVPDNLSSILRRNRKFRPTSALAGATAALGISLASCGPLESDATSEPSGTTSSPTSEDASPSTTTIAPSKSPDTGVLGAETYVPKVNVPMPVADGVDVFYTGGPHNYNAQKNKPTNLIRGAIDIAPKDIDCVNGIVPFPVVSVVDGVVTLVNERTGFVNVKGSGQKDLVIEYEHLAGINKDNLSDGKVIVGESIADGVGCSNDQRHLHFQLQNSKGEQLPIAGSTIGGWTIYEYEGNYDGYATKSGQKRIADEYHIVGKNDLILSSKGGTGNVGPEETEAPASSYERIVDILTEAVALRPEEAAQVISKIAGELPSDPEKAADAVSLLLWLSYLNGTQFYGYPGLFSNYFQYPPEERKNHFYEDGRFMFTSRIKNLGKFASQIPTILADGASSPNNPLEIEFAKIEDQNHNYKLIGTARIANIQIDQTLFSLKGAQYAKGILYSVSYGGYVYHLSGDADENQIKKFLSDLKPHKEFPPLSKAYIGESFVQIFGDPTNPSGIIFNGGGWDTDYDSYSYRHYIPMFSPFAIYQNLPLAGGEGAPITSDEIYRLQYEHRNADPINPIPTEGYIPREGFETVKVDLAIEPTPSPEIKNLKTYKDADFNFKYPSKWQLEDKAGKDKIGNPYKALRIAYDKGNLQRGTIILFQSVPGLFDLDYVFGIYQQNVKVKKDYGVSEEGFGNIDTAYRWEFDAQEGKNVIHKVVYVGVISAGTSGSKAIILEASSAPKYKAEISKVFNALAGNLVVNR